MSMPQHSRAVTEKLGGVRGARASGRLEVAPLSPRERDEALGFLDAEAVDSIYMSGLIADNGIVSAANRGTFFGARTREGRLVGVALIGHFICAQTGDEDALAAFARLAQDRQAHMLVGDPEKIERFWRHYGRGGQQPRLICRELFFERRAPVEVTEPVPALRLATTADLFQIAQVNATSKASSFTRKSAGAESAAAASRSSRACCSNAPSRSASSSTSRTATRRSSSSRRVSSCAGSTTRST